MKSSFFKTFAPLLILFSAACSTPSKEWRELDSFHLIMADAFHPYKDSSNLAPAKSLAKAMAEEANKWESSTLPEKVDTKEMKARLHKLNADSQSFLELTSSSATDSVLGQSLTDLHHLFHEIQEDWYKGEENHERH